MPVTNLVGVPHLQPGDLPLCQLPPTQSELQEVHFKLDALLLRIPHIPAVPALPLAMLPPPALPHTRISSDASGQLYTTVMAMAPPPYSPPSHALSLDGLPTSAPVPLGAPQMVHEKSRTLRFGSGHVITFTAQDVPPPPTTTFPDNIPHLNSMWDDTTGHWNRDSVLRIHGHPIALVYWPVVYTRWRPGDWDTLKTQFGHWKVHHPRFAACPFSS